MPAIIARQIASQIAVRPTEQNVRQVVTAGIQTAAASGYDAEIATIFAELCEDLRQLIDGETDPQRQSGLQASLNLVRTLADEYGGAAPPPAGAFS
jgi:hypothetical protein